VSPHVFAFCAKEECPGYLGCEEHLRCEERLRGLELFSPEKRSLWEDLRAAFQCLKGPTRQLERDFLQGHGVIGQGVMALN